MSLMRGSAEYRACLSARPRSPHPGNYKPEMTSSISAWLRLACPVKIVSPSGMAHQRPANRKETKAFHARSDTVTGTSRFENALSR